MKLSAKVSEAKKAKKKATEDMPMDVDTTMMDDQAMMDDKKSAVKSADDTTDEAGENKEPLLDENQVVTDAENDDSHDVTIECNGAIMPSLVNLLVILKHHCDNNLTAELTIANCACGNEDLHGKNGSHKIVIGGETSDGDLIDDIVVDDSDYDAWIDEQIANKVKLVS